MLLTFLTLRLSLKLLKTAKWFLLPLGLRNLKSRGDQEAYRKVDYGHFN